MYTTDIRETTTIINKSNTLVEPNELLNSKKEVASQVEKMKNSSANPAFGAKQQQFSPASQTRSSQWQSSQYNSKKDQYNSPKESLVSHKAQSYNTSTVQSPLMRQSQQKKFQAYDQYSATDSKQQSAQGRSDLLEELKVANQRIRDVSQDIQELTKSMQLRNQDIKRTQQASNNQFSELKRSQQTINTQQPTYQNRQFDDTHSNASQYTNSVSGSKFVTPLKETRKNTFGEESQTRYNAFQTPAQQTQRSEIYNSPVSDHSSNQKYTTNYKRTFVKADHIEYEQYDDEINPEKNFKAFRETENEEWQRVNTVPDNVKQILALQAKAKAEASNDQSFRIEKLGAPRNEMSGSKSLSRGGFNDQYEAQSISYHS